MSTSGSRLPIRRSSQKKDGERWIFDNLRFNQGIALRHSIKNKDFQIFADNSECVSNTVLHQSCETDFCRNSLIGIVRIPMKADRIKINQIGSGFFSPVLGPLVRNRRAMVLLAAVTVVQVALTAAGNIAWQCPVKTTLGVACPACGLTRAVVLFAQGHWKAAFDLHAFAPIFFGGGIFLVAGSILPVRLQQKIAYQIAAFERLTGIVGLLIIGIIAYWILRIVNLMNP
jgi:hypothetical protein